MHLPNGIISRIKTQWLAAGIALILVFGLTACNRERGVEAARDEVVPSVSPEDQDFMGKAAEGHQSEILMARVALLKSGNNDVKDYANMIEKDHSAALKDIVELMNDKRVSKPQTLNDETKQHLSAMNELKGPEFDREFVNMMVSGHENAVEMYQSELATVQNPDLKDYIEGLKPKLEMHLEKGQQLQSKLFNTPTKPQR
jgi:putative membrane protein